MENKIILTDTATAKIKENLAKRGHGVGIKIGVRTTGCSGLAYVLEYLDSIEGIDSEKQFIQPHDGIYVSINTADLPYFRDLRVDYAKQGLNEGFEFSNAAEKSRCGCGESFRVK